jgi:hypothetical protein
VRKAITHGESDLLRVAKKQWLRVVEQPTYHHEPRRAFLVTPLRRTLESIATHSHSYAATMRTSSGTEPPAEEPRIERAQRAARSFVVMLRVEYS